ncbi:MAG: endonuclease/exonuclease/phosphatase family protein [Planctomycetia bacterium]
MLGGVCTALVAAAVAGDIAAENAAENAAEARAPGDTRDCRLRIACFNVENLAAPAEQPRMNRFRFEPARRRHLERIAAVIEALAPDIIVLPEVISHRGVDALATILHEKGLADYRGWHVDGSDAFSGFDVAILARIEPDLVDGRRIAIHVPARKGGRRRDDAEPDAASQGAADDAWLRQAYTTIDDAGRERAEEAVLQRHALAYFTVCGRKLGVLGVHLKSNPSDQSANAQRTAETRIARDIIRRKIVAKGYLPVVLGDINDYDPDVPMADRRRRTQTTVLRDLKDFDPGREGAELVNVASFIPRVADRYTSHWDFNENGGPDAHDVFTLFDHILVPRELESAIRRAFICHATDLDVSDHFPVVVDLDLGPPAGR